MITSEKIDELAKALNKVQSELQSAKNDAVNPFFKSKYATFGSVWDVVRDPMVKNGLCLTQNALSCPEGVSVVSRLIHESGQYIEYGPLIVPMAKKDAHATGSGISYAKRYALVAIFGVVTDDDDDGNAAVKPTNKSIPHVKKEDFLAKYGKDDADFLMQYVAEYSKFHKIDEQRSINTLCSDEKKFLKNFDTWMKNQCAE